MACDNKIINIRIAERYFENLQIFENQYTLKKIHESREIQK